MSLSDNNVLDEECLEPVEIPSQLGVTESRVDRVDNHVISRNPSERKTIQHIDS
jgi:hypothetical protein